MKSVIVAVTAASGAIYARQLLSLLAESAEVERIALIYSTHAREVAEFEGEQMPESAKITVYDNGNLFASPASGSAGWDAMAVVPSSVGTVGRIASGFGSQRKCDHSGRKPNVGVDYVPKLFQNVSEVGRDDRNGDDGSRRIGQHV